ncbi:hypothetical protein A3Q56_07014 [Intoshia linei]|uniref:Uncharacterized protein n=1 Tax=Intoshia linei TaxID=1819745 RepID=A0A177ATD8_9BILA|nr:hypothetical protein A3Q56_07014 [Intoshia linei]
MISTEYSTKTEKKVAALMLLVSIISTFMSIYYVYRINEIASRLFENEMYGLFPPAFFPMMHANLAFNITCIFLIVILLRGIYLLNSTSSKIINLTE